MKYRIQFKWMGTFKLILELVLPPLVYSYLIYRYARFLHKANFSRLNFMPVGSDNGRCVIIANGPSFKNVDPVKLKGVDCIVMNSFWLYENADKLNIVALCIGDPQLTSQEDLDIKAIENTKTKSIVLDVSKYGKYEARFKDKNFFYVACYIPHAIYFGKKICLDKPFMNYQTSAQLAIMTAIQLGYSEIALLGFDHTWLVEMDRSSHFYDLDGDREGSFHFSELGFSYLDRIKASKSMFEIYYKIREIADKSNIRIKNFSSNSYLDVFERGDPKIYEASRNDSRI